MSHITRVFLHISMIESHPELMAYKSSDVKLFVFQHTEEGIRQEARKGQELEWRRILGILEMAKEKGHVEVLSVPKAPLSVDPVLSPEQLAFVTLVHIEHKKARGHREEVVIATTSAEMRRYCRRREIGITAYHRVRDILSLMEKDKVANDDIKRKAEEITIAPGYGYVGPGVAVVVATLLIIGLQKVLHSPTLLNEVSPWLLFWVALPLGLFMYGWKEFYLFSYGLTELLFGLGSLWILVVDQPKLLSEVPNVFKIATTIFIIVRGLENINKSKGIPIRDWLVPAKRIISRLFMG